MTTPTTAPVRRWIVRITIGSFSVAALLGIDPQVLERLTGTTFEPGAYPVAPRIQERSSDPPPRSRISRRMARRRSA